MTEHSSSPEGLTSIDVLRIEARELVNQDMDNLAMRSCWDCNPAHEHLKEVDYVITCFDCGRFFYKGIDITE
jgi:hypothetical protein